MKNQRTFRASTFWTLFAGIGIGAECMASILGGPHSSNLAQAQSLPVVRSISATTSDTAATLHALDKSFANLAEFASPAVVQIQSESKGSADLMGRMMPIGGEGSGVIIRPDGYIVTNDHVVGGFDKVKVLLQDGRTFPGTVMRAEESDIAVVKIDAKDLPTLAFADSAAVRPGEFSIAIGSPFGFENSVTVGHISALGRQNAIRDGRNGMRAYTDLIQTDTPINMGNSGGPLINIDGQIIGINTSIYSQSGGSNGIGFAIPSNQARLIAEMLIDHKKIVRAAIGIIPGDLKEFQKKELGLEGGSMVVTVPSNGPAAMAGIKEKDVIVRIGRFPIKSQIDVRNSMFQYAPGSKVDIEYVRSGQHRTTEVTLIDSKALNQLTPTDHQDQDGPDLQDPRGGFELPVPRDMPEGQTPRNGKPRLGVSVKTLDDSTRKQFDIPHDVKGALVVGVQPGSIAEDVLKLQPGDVILQVDETKIETDEQLSKVISQVKAGDKRTITYGRFSSSARSRVRADVFFK